MKRITDLAIGTKVEVESIWHDERLHGVVSEPPKWAKQRTGEFIPVQTEEEVEEGVRLYQPHAIFVEENPSPSSTGLVERIEAVLSNALMERGIANAEGRRDAP